MFPLSFLPLVVAAPPRMPPRFPGGEELVGQESGEAALQAVRRPAHGVRRVAVVAALAVEAEVAGGTDEEGLQQLAVGDVVDLRGDVERPAAHRHRPAKAQQPARRGT